MKRHYIGMAGLRGYMPNHCGLYDSFDGACESLIEMHDVGWEMLDGEKLILAVEAFEGAEEDLHEFGFATLNLHIHGNEYMQVTECNCSTPWEHSNQPLQDTLDYLGYSEEEAREALKNPDSDRFIVGSIQDYLDLLARHVDVMCEEPKEPREEDYPTEADFDLALAQFDEKM